MLPLLLILSCAPAANVDLSPEAWRQKLTAARPGEHDAWLERLKLKPVTSPTWSAPTLEGVELRTAKLSGGKKPEVLVVATFKAKLKEKRELFSDEVRLYRVQVLQPSGSSWCAISDALSADVIVEKQNAGPADGMKDTALPRTLSLVNFSHPGQQTIELHMPFETVSRFTAKGDEIEWWDLIEGKLVQILKTPVKTIQCPNCDVPHFRSWYERRGTPPVSIMAFQVSCEDSTEKVCPTREEHLLVPTWQELK